VGAEDKEKSNKFPKKNERRAFGPSLPSAVTSFFEALEDAGITLGYVGVV
jgi:hypothetical protein